MVLKDKVVVVTGGAGGIGSALGRRFLAEGARAVVLADRDPTRTREVATAMGAGARGVACDAGDDAEVKALIDEVERLEGPIDLYCANAGIALGTTPESNDSEWADAWHVNLMGTVVAARHLLPRWLERGGGYLLVTASAAGLLTTLGDAAYTATKHAAVGLAEWIWITYSDRGVKVSCLCPQGVRTDMVLRPAAAGAVGTEQVIRMGLIEPEQVAGAVVEGLADERFLILPHPEVAEYFRNKGENHGRWLSGMRKMQRQLGSTKTE
jgi:NAD(P)-dependent dehydrogenase (short-subunit alcohol dehydrogenase family)